MRRPVNRVLWTGTVDGARCSVYADGRVTSVVNGLEQRVLDANPVIALCVSQLAERAASAEAELRKRRMRREA